MRLSKIVFSLIIVFSCIPAFGLIFLIDGSGSMEGFAKTGAIKQQVEEISEIAGEGSNLSQINLFTTNDALTVNTRDIQISDLNNVLNFRGKDTLLGAMANQCLTGGKPGSYVILTDNVQDDRRNQGNSKEFYDQLLCSNVINSVDISPRILKFDGNPYRGPLSQYRGDAGLIIYFVNVGSDQKAKNSNIRLLKGLTNQGYTLFHIRPITSTHVQLNSPKGSKGRFKIYSEKGKYYLKLRDDGKGKSGPVLKIDTKNIIDFSIIMESHYPYIGIAPNTSVDIENFRINCPDMNLKFAKPKISVDPSKLPKALEEGGKQMFNAKIGLKPTDPSFIQRIASMFNPKRGVVSFDMVLGTSQNSIYMVGKTRNEFFTDNAAVYNKIYSSVDIISHFNPQNNKITFNVENENDIKDFSTQIKLMYDNWWVFLLMVLILGFLISIGMFLYSWFNAPNLLFVTVESQPDNDIEEHILRRFSTVPSKACFIKRKLSNVKVVLKDSKHFYFKDSTFKSIDLPPRVVREIKERDSNKLIRIYMNTHRRNNA